MVRFIRSFSLLLFFLALSGPRAQAGGEKAIPETNRNIRFGIPVPLKELPDKEDLLIKRDQYVLSYNGRKNTANWVSWQLLKGDLGKATRRPFHEDPALPRGYSRVVTSHYNGSGFDRGHLCPSADRSDTEENNDPTFFMTNILPQAPNLNQHPWERLETYCRDQAKANAEVKVRYERPSFLENGSRELAVGISNADVAKPMALVEKKTDGKEEIKAWTSRLIGQHTKEVTSLALSSDAKLLFSGSTDETIKVWDMVTGKEVKRLRGHTGDVTALTLSSDSKRVFSGSLDKSIKVWDLEAGKEVMSLRGHKNEVTNLVLAPDGKRLFSCSHDMTIMEWDLEAGKEIRSLRGHTGGIWSLALSPDGKRLFSGSYDKTIRIWDLGSGKEELSLRGHTGAIRNLVLSSDGKLLFSAGGLEDGTIKVWDLMKGKEIKCLRGHTDGVTSLALSKNGKHLFSGSWDKTIKVWDLDSDKEVKSLTGHTFIVWSLVLSSDNTRLFSGSLDKTIRVWDLGLGH